MPKLEADHPKRRRGADLENAVLSSAWELLQEVGYQDFTMAEVAKRANAAKPVLYRRWSEKSSLAATAILKFGPKLDVTIPDTGNLRQDLIEFFNQLIKIFDMFGAEKLKGLVTDRLKSIPMGKLFSASNSENKLQTAVEQILKQAEKRGELTVAELPLRVLHLPSVLFINEVVDQEAVTREVIAQIVDDILVPVFTAKK
ncbi:TetR/AcrR family transcriptional regulator [Companilactobacillus nodensis]|uniref:Transcriptional regulator n=1 Tax=Companilactobacillus nodensis DSM 19682 = JCM 14932 = NBRC 107160 TaxID=1423775 RepID=A0A0R1KBV4_9LACO|nr:TetR/AcrR family transcriptional regulator [Companilactobacillus nodensis]KRK80859.1 transcriptional regulator [Companilactobacillus nodensis DSM 19682 = JCM 14932 = NBRC 107160]